MNYFVLGFLIPIAMTASCTSTMDFIKSPTGQALTQTATTLLVSEAVEKNPELEQTFTDLADNLEKEGSELSPDGIRAGLAQVQPKSNK